MIPTSIDGTDITGATIDGTDVQEITVDGDVVFSAGTFPVAYSNLVAWYPFDSGEYGGSNADDVTAILGGSGNDTAFDGNVSGPSYQSSGGVTDIRAGVNSGGFDFQGSNDRITVSGSGIKLTTQTVMGWFNADTTSGPMSSLMHANSSGSRSGFNFVWVNGDVQVRLENAAASNPVNINSGSFSTGTWTHIAMTTSGTNGTCEVFRDGSFVGSDTYSNYVPTNSDMSIGTSLDGFWVDYDGQIDDVRIYNSVLSSTEINDIYQNTEP